MWEERNCHSGHEDRSQGVKGAGDLQRHGSVNSVFTITITALNFGRIDLPGIVPYVQLEKKSRGYAGDATDLLEIGLRSPLLLHIAQL